MSVRTRFAPSPTGYLHIGGLRTALYGYLFAKKHGGDFILRIEDTDQQRQVEGATELIYQTLRDTGLHYDEGPDIGGDYGPYIQTERREIYEVYAQKLIENKSAYRCFCTKDRLEALRNEQGDAFKYDKHCKSLGEDEISRKLDAREPYVIRFDMPTAGGASFDDAVYGPISVDSDSLDDMVLLKSDGLPTYNFANVIDDHLMNISHVIRGSEYLSSTPKYNLIYEAFGWEKPAYIHLPPVMKDKHRKLSKRYGDASYEDFISRGYLKEAIINYIALLGWSPGGEQEKFTLTELCALFDIKGISKSPAIFDEAKLSWLNGEYIRAMSVQAFDEIAQPYYDACWERGRFDTLIISRILQPRVDVMSQIKEKVGFLLELCDYDVALYNHKKMKTNEQTSLQALSEAISVLRALRVWDESSVHEALVTLAQQLGMKNGQIMWPVRIAMTGQQVTPGGAVEIAVILGKKEALRRMEDGARRLKSVQHPCK